MRHRILISVGVVLVALGLALAALPTSWIEDTLGFEPDGGNGAFELLVALGPIVVGLALIVAAAIDLRRAAGNDVQPTNESAV